MGKISLNKQGEFLVGEEKPLNYTMAVLFSGLFLYGAIDAFVQHFTKLNYISFLFGVALLPAIYFFQKGRSNRIYLRINKKGLYQDEQLVTDWSNLLKAYISQQEKLLSIQDNFILVVEYTKDELSEGFRRKIPLTNTQDKSEEDVLAAIQFFWKEYQNENTFH